MGSMRPDRVASYVEQMAMIFPAKKFIRSALARYGYRLVPIEEHDAPTGRDAENAADLLQAITPEVQANAATGTWPTPAFLYGYFSPHRLAMVRLLLEQCEAADIEIAGKRVLDVGCHAGCLLRLIAARYPDATPVGCDAELFFCSLSELKQWKSYDVVFLMQVLEHLVEPEAAVRHLVELLADGGTLVLTVPDGRVDSYAAENFNPELQSYGGHVNFWSPESWQYFLARVAPDCGLSTAKLETGQLFAALTRKPRSAN